MVFGDFSCQKFWRILGGVRHLLVLKLANIESLISFFLSFFALNMFFSHF